MQVWDGSTVALPLPREFSHSGGSHLRGHLVWKTAGFISTWLLPLLAFKAASLHLAFSQPLGLARPPPQPSLALLSSHGLPYKPSGKHTPLASLYISVSPEAKKQTRVPALGELRALPCNKAVMEPRPHLLLEGKEESFGPCS